MLTAELGCFAHVVTPPDPVPCGRPILVRTRHEKHLSIDCTAVCADRPGLTNKNLCELI